MNRSLRWIALFGFFAISMLLTAGGCQQDKGKPAPKADTAAKGKDKDADKDKHDHDEVGPHNGPLAEWDDKYHAEFTVDHAKKSVIVYILDDKAKAAPKMEPDKITNVKLTVTGTKPLLQLELKHDAKQSGEKGIAYTTTHDHFEKPAEIKGNISGKVDGKPYSGDFTYTAPKKAALYLKPGGIYTSADIKANGGVTPAVKFQGKEWAHDDNLKPGDKLCPVTNNKAESECAWIVDGQRYEFCCPPCLDKFIGWAHYEPTKVKKADDYVFTGK